MNVLIIPSWYPHTSNDISGSFFREQAIALKEQGCKVAVITQQLRPLRNWQSIMLEGHGVSFEEDQGIPTLRKHGMKWFPWLPKLQAWQCKKDILGMFEQYIRTYGRPDIIHVHSMLYAGWAAKAISEKYKIPYVITEHSSLYARGLITSAQKKIATKISNSACKRYAVSNSFSRFLSTYLEVGNMCWGVMPNMVSSRFFNASDDNHGKNKVFVFISVGYLNSNKGIDVLIKAFATALKSEPALRLMIAGVGEEQSILQALVYELGISKSVNFLGGLNRCQVVQHMLSADTLVHSSFYETFGVVLIEALALGKPVIATRCGGPEDIVREQDGILVNVGDDGELAEAMLKLHADRKTYNKEELIEACYARFSEEAITNKWMKIYRKEVVDGASENE